MENQLVLLKDPNTKPLDWPMGRILEVFPGSDGLVRVVNVKTSTGILKRAITKVVPLPIPVDPATSLRDIVTSCSKSKEVIRERRPGVLRSGVLLLDDNARPHLPQRKTISQLLIGSAYTIRPVLISHQVTILCFWLWRSGSNAEVKQAVRRFLRMQSPEFFLGGFLKLIKRYDKCLNVLGTYVEK
ncbi:histone-lysine N-methyltransferase SETMAR [Trichonephila clavipes]|nr:histone-lysine N-methyltransferase SETMAR [Trichonephila clavipes]